MEYQINKNYSEWTEEEKEAFAKRKEFEYKIRRDRVSEYCDGQRSNFSRKVYTLVHDNVDNVRDSKHDKSTLLCQHNQFHSRVYI